MNVDIVVRAGERERVDGHLHWANTKVLVVFNPALTCVLLHALLHFRHFDVRMQIEEEALNTLDKHVQIFDWIIGREK